MIGTSRCPGSWDWLLLLVGIPSSAADKHWFRMVGGSTEKLLQTHLRSVERRRQESAAAPVAPSMRSYFAAMLRCADLRDARRSVSAPSAERFALGATLLAAAAAVHAVHAVRASAWLGVLAALVAAGCGWWLFRRTGHWLVGLLAARLGPALRVPPAAELLRRADSVPQGMLLSARDIGESPGET